MRKQVAVFVLGALANSLASPLTAQDVPRIRIPYRHLPVVVDGSLDEWGGTPSLPIRRADQMWEAETRGGWGGVEDISAELFLAYDEAHLYVAGRVHDDSFVRHTAGQRPEHADAIELFFNFDLEDDRAPRAGDGAVPFNDGDLQVFLMPLVPTRPWEIVVYGGETGEKTRLGSTAFSGCKMARVDLPPQQYTFEAVLPLHHLGGLQPGTHEIGFTVALDDWDSHRQDRYAYMTWNGLNPISPREDTRVMGRLEFGHPSDPRPLEVTAAARGSSVDLGVDLPYLFGPLLLVLAVFVLLRWWRALGRSRSFLRPLGRVLGVAVFAAGLLLPGLWMDVHRSRSEARLQEVVDTLREAVPKMEKGTLASYLGPNRDRPLVDLLRGRPVARQRYLTYRPLVELVEHGFGAEPITFPSDFFKILPYWIPLPLDGVEQIDFSQPLEGHSLYLVVGWPYADFPIERQVEVPEVTLTLQPPSGPAGAAEPTVEELVFDGVPEYGDAFGREGFAVSFATVRLPGPVAGLKLANLNREDLRLVGLALVPTDNEAAVPQRLGRVSTGGIETDLRGPLPLRAGTEVRGGGPVRRVVLPAAERTPYDKVWFFYRGAYPGPQVETVAAGVPVAEVSIRFVNRKLAPKIITFTHQQTMFFESSRHNDVGEPPPDAGVEVAFTWLDEDQEQRRNYVLQVDLPRGELVEAIEFKGLGPYPVRFRSVVFGIEKQAAPQDLGDSPLVAGRDGRERVLRPEVLEAVSGASVALFRDARATAAVLRWQGEEWTALPRGVSAALASVGDDQVVRFRPDDEGQSRRFQAYYRLTGDGWGGAVLGASFTAEDYVDEERLAHLVGIVLCILGAPLLLVLFSEVLTVLNNLRLRLMVVLAVASLVPLTVLSIVLVRVLESGHRQDLEANLRRNLATAAGQLEERVARLSDTGNRWLTGLVEEFRMAAGRGDPAEGIEPLRSALVGRMNAQLPEEWQGGFLKLDFQPDPEARDPLLGFSVAAGDPLLAAFETPLRSEPGLYQIWGRLVVGVRCEQDVTGGRLALSAGRPLEDSLLGSVLPGHAMLLTDVHGYPLAVASGDGAESHTLLRAARRPDAMQARQKAALAGPSPVAVDRWVLPHGDWLVSQSILRDLQGTPRALLAVLAPHTRATLELAFGAVPVRAFFMLVAGLLVTLSVFLSYVVTSRISRPIEQLEKGAQAIARGRLDTRVEIEEGGQLGRLTRTFNAMAGDLQSRIQDMSLLNRAIRELNSHLDLDETLAAARAFYEQQSPADRVLLALFDPGRNELMVHGSEPRLCLDDRVPEVADLLRASGPYSMLLGPGSALGKAYPGFRSAVVLPLVLGHRCVGAVLLLFERRHPLPVHLELFTTMAGQAAVAIENAWLYRQAVRDPGTGAWRPDSFRRLVSEEVGRAQERGQPMALIGLRPDDGPGWQGLLDPEQQREAVEGLGRSLRHMLPQNAIVGHLGGGEFQVAVPGADRRQAAALLTRILGDWRDCLPTLGVEKAEGTPQGVAVVYPDDAASASILLDALAQRWLRDPAADSAQEEIARHLEKEGVFAASQAMQDVYRILRRVAPTDLTLLLEGETGVGKEVVTNLVHRWSKRAAGPLVKVHCAALSESLLQSELFGHEKGAFTGADSRKLGRFELAQGGTLFLDEIGEISLETQVKLLRVLQEREIERVGGIAPVPVDVRIVAATNRDIPAMVDEGAFRRDLYYRLQGMVVRIPPLRERRQEIPQLVEYFLHEAAEGGQTHVEGFSTDALDELYGRDWPGNIRELRNAVFRAVVFAQGPKVERVDLHGLHGERRAAAEPPEVAHAPAGTAAQGPLDKRLRRLLDLVTGRGGEITTMEYVRAVGVSRRTGLRDLQRLVDLGYLDRIGKRRGARYRYHSA